MTGRERGRDRYRPGPSGEQPRAAPVLEELAAQPVVARGWSRPGWRGTFAAAGTFGLLAAGFGLFGGREVPAPSARATAPHEAPATGVPLEYEFPKVTPWADCAPPPSSAPAVMLDVNGDVSPGSVVLFPGLGAVATPPTALTPPPDAARVVVPLDARAELWVAGGACANAWTIDADDELILDTVYNPGLDPGYAAQNRFRLSLAEYRFRDVDWDFTLTATLRFPAFAVQATWAIRVPVFRLPSAALSSGGLSVSAIPGCDVSLGLRNGWQQPRGPGCLDDIGTWAEFEPPLQVEPAERLTFRLDPWAIDTAHVICGRMSAQSFVGPEAGCALAPGGFAGSVEFAAPEVAGPWTLAIEGCAEDDKDGGNRICGTWYGSVRVRG